VFKGGSSYLMSKVLKGKLFSFDTFEGLPKEDKRFDNQHFKGEFKEAVYEEVKEFLSVNKNNIVIKGLFPESSQGIVLENLELIHIDVDIYPSVIDSLKFLYKKANKGAVIIFDDYGFSSCKGARIAVDEFFKDKNEYPIYLETGQSMVIKQ
jgi:O-methyltransferase